METDNEQASFKSKVHYCNLNRIELPIKKQQQQKANNMLKVITSLLLALSVASRMADAIMSLPDGIETILGFAPRSTFQCERDGYFGDIDNDCRIFHLCQKQVHPNGRTEWRHWTYACGNQTMFNQLTLTCAFVDEAIPCKHASQFQYLNEVIHKPREPFLTDADVTSGISYYSNRVMSDGARARAFEDSKLMAQIGGGNILATSPAINHHNQQQHHHHNHNQNHQFTHNSQGPAALSNTFQTSNNNNLDAAVASDRTEDRSNMAVNSIDVVPEFPSLSESFQALNRLNDEQPATVLPQAAVVHRAAPASTNNQAQITINHQHHVQHHTSNNNNNNPTRPHHFSGSLSHFSSLSPEAPSLEQQGFIRQQQQQQPAQQFAAPPAALPTTSSSATATTSSPNSFDFSISTNHQVGPPARSFDSSIVLSSSANSNHDQFTTRAHQLLPQQQQSVVATAPTTPTTTTGAPSLLLLSPTTEQSSGQQQQVGFSPPESPSSASAESVPNFNNQPLATFVPTSTSQSADQTTTVSQPTTTTITNAGSTNQQPTATESQAAGASPTTTTTLRSQLPPSPIATTERAPAQVRRRQADQQQQTSGRTRQQHRNQLRLNHSFHSTRLSGAARQQPQQNQDGSAIVMRRHLASSSVGSPQVAAPTTPAQTVAAGRPATVTLESGNSFWRRSFEAQLMSPRFESLLMRRRV